MVARILLLSGHYKRFSRLFWVVALVFLNGCYGVLGDCLGIDSWLLDMS